MRHVSRYRPSLSMVMVSVALLVTVGGVAFASIPGSGGVVHACYQKTRGGLRVIDTAKRGFDGKCRKSEKSLAWNQQGPRGLQGAQGTQGLQGARGDKGDQGPGAVTLNYSNTSPSNSGSPPMTTLGTVGPFTFLADCTIDGSTNDVTMDLILTSTAVHAAEGVIFARTDDIGAVTPNMIAVTNRPAAGGRLVGLGATSTHFNRFIFSPLLLHAGSKAVNVNLHVLVDARTASPSCTLDGQVVPSS